MIKVKDGYGKLIDNNFRGVISQVLSSDGGNIEYSTSSKAGTLVRRNSSGQIESTLTTDSKLSPFKITSTYLNTNLNADLLDGYQANGLFESLTSTKDSNLKIKIGGTEKSVADLYATFDASGNNIATYYVTLSTDQTISGTKTFSKQIISNYKDGAPFSVASSALVTNLNADLLDNYHASGLFTALGSSATTNLSVTIGGTTKNITNLYSGYLRVQDIRGTNHAPNATVYPAQHITGWFNNTGTPSSSWYSGIAVRGWTEAYTTWQLASYADTGTTNSYNLYFRHGNSSWGSWKTILDSSNYKDVIGAGSFWKVNAQTYNGSSSSISSGDIYLEMWRGSYASWKMLNTHGILKFQSNYTSTVGSYYDCLTITYNSGNTWIKGDTSSNNFISRAATGTQPYACTSTTVNNNLNADMLDGLHIHTGRNNEANKVVRTDANGFIQAGWINTTSGNMGTTAATRIYCSNDEYIRYKTPANFFETLTNDGNQISITVGSQNRKLTVNYASFTKRLDNVGLPSCTSNEANTVWCKFARVAVNDAAWSNASGYLFFGGGESPDNRGILLYHFRAGSNTTTLSSAELRWLVKSYDNATVIAVKVEDNVYDLYTNNAGTYMRPRIYHMSAFSSRFAWSIGNWTTTKPTAAYTSSDVGRVQYAKSATQVIVNQHTANNVEYPLVWSNSGNTLTTTGNQLYKSYSHLTYNPSAHRISTGQYIANNSSGPHFTANSATGSWAYLRLNNGSTYWSIATKSDSASGGLWLARLNSADDGIFVSTGNSVGISTSSPSDKLHVNGGQIRSTYSSKYLRIGPQNSSHARYETDADISHWFNKRVEVNGHVNPYSDNSFTSGISDKRWSNVYSYLGNFKDTVHIYAKSPGHYTEGIRLYGAAKDSTYSNIHFGCDPAATNGNHANQWMLGRDDNNRFVLRNYSTNRLYVLSDGKVGINVVPTQMLHVNGNAMATNLGVNAQGGGNGISLFNGVENVGTYGIAFNQTSNWGTHGYVSGDWATYFTMNNQGDRGWIFRAGSNRFSIDGNGRAYTNGLVNANYFVSRVATGTQPYQCTSTTCNTNLNADMLDGYHASSFICYRNYISLSALPSGISGWYKIATISDWEGSPCIFMVRTYAHCSAIFTVSKGYDTYGNITQLNYCESNNSSYCYIQGARLLKDGTVEILLNKPIANNDPYVQINISMYNPNNIKLNSTLTLDSSSPEVIQSITFVNASIQATHFYEFSDINLKTNIQPIIDSDNIPKLRKFNWKNSGKIGYGFIAQELEEQGYCELVSGEKDGTKTVHYSAALSLIVGKLQVKIKELEKEIEILKNKN